MKITIFGANTIVGKKVIALALANNFIVKAFDRNIENLIDADLRNENFEAIKGYVFDKDEVLEAVKNSDAIISCLGGSMNSTNKSRSLGMKNIVEAMQKAHVKRIVAVSGVGILSFDENKLVIDLDDFPSELKEESFEHLAAYEHLKSTELDWTLVCPSKIIDADSSLDYDIKENYLPNQNLENVNSGDIADFILKGIKDKIFFKSRIGISTKN